MWLGGSGASVTCADECHAQEHVDLGGEALVPGPRNMQDSASACCDACTSHRAKASAAGGKGCNVWVFCGNASACGRNHRHCWLKWQPEPMLRPMVSGLGVAWSTLVPWTAGVHGDAVAVKAARRAAAEPLPQPSEAHVALVTHLGPVRLRLRHGGSPKASAWLQRLAHGAARGCSGCRFYRAEPVPPGWGQKWFFGPPYALLQGTFRSDGAAAADQQPSLSREEGGVLKRGQLIIIDKGPDFLIGLASHPEWAPSYTHVADVVGEDMAVVDRIMAEPLKEESWGSITATVFGANGPVRFNLTTTPRQQQ